MNEIKKDWTPEDLDQLRKIFMENHFYKTMHHPLWKQAFAFHNSINPPHKKLGMGCRPCYIKVANFIENQLNNHNRES